jgi:hypothetical protein
MTERLQTTAQMGFVKTMLMLFNLAFWVSFQFFYDIFYQHMESYFQSVDSFVRFIIFFIHANTNPTNYTIR